MNICTSVAAAVSTQTACVNAAAAKQAAGTPLPGQPSLAGAEVFLGGGRTFLVGWWALWHVHSSVGPMQVACVGPRQHVDCAVKICAYHSSRHAITSLKNLVLETLGAQ